MAFQLVNTQFAKPRSFIDPSVLMHFSVGQILSCCKWGWWQRCPYFVICTDIPMSRSAWMSPCHDLHGCPHVVICMDVPVLWSDSSSVLQQKWVSKSYTSELYGIGTFHWCKIQIPSSKLLTFAYGLKRDRWFLENNIHPHFYHSVSYCFLM